MNLFSLIISSLIIYYANANCDVSVLDMVIVLDESGSIGIPSYEYAREAVYKMVSNLNVNPNKVHVGLIRYSTYVSSVRSLIATDQDKSDLLNYITYMTYMDGSTATGDAINDAKKMFNRFGRPATPRIAVVFTDGGSNTGSSVYTASDLLKGDKVHVFAVGIGNSINDYELTYIASEPKNRYKKLVSDYTALVTAINEITNVVCGTNAIILVGEKVTIQTAQNEVRNFETDLSSLVNAKTTYLELVLTNKKGFSNVSYSFTNPNPISFTMSSTRETIDENGLRTLYFDIPVPPSAKLFYFAVKTITTGANEYDIELNKY